MDFCHNIISDVVQSIPIRTRRCNTISAIAYEPEDHRILSTRNDVNRPVPNAKSRTLTACGKIDSVSNSKRDESSLAVAISGQIVHNESTEAIDISTGISVISSKCTDTGDEQYSTESECKY